MQTIKAINVVFPCNSTFFPERLEAYASAPFSEATKKFLHIFTNTLIRNPKTREYSELIQLAAWFSKKSVKALEDKFTSSIPYDCLPTSRGVALHFAPGNVDTIFIYSAFLSLLAGNCTIVRIPTKKTPQIEHLICALNQAYKETNYDQLYVIQYERSDEVSSYLSKLCDVRVIWGGDDSVSNIRLHPLRVDARDIAFPNKRSFSVICTESFLGSPKKNIEALCKNFINDAYWFGQLACSSPRVIIWKGDGNKSKIASKEFWERVENGIKFFPEGISQITYIDKLVAQCRAAIDGCTSSIKPSKSNLISVCELSSLENYTNSFETIGGGLFWESNIKTLDELRGVLDCKSQTIGSYGIDRAEWKEWASKGNTRINRIVHIGEALKFNYIWDGMDLLKEFTRLITISC
jgi:hypothetical protein